MTITKSNINTILETLATIWKALSITSWDNKTVTVQVAKAYNTSNEVGPVNLPFVNFEVKNSPSEFLAADVQRVRDDITMWLNVHTSEENVDIDLNEEDALRWRDVVFTAFAGHYRLGGLLPFIQEAHIDMHGHVQNHRYGDSIYYAIPFLLTVVEAFPIPIIE